MTAQVDERRAAAARATDGPATSERDALRLRILAALQGEVAAPATTDAEPSRLRALAGRFGLNALEADVLAVLWVTAFEAELRQILADADAEAAAGHITVRLVADLFGHAARVRLSSESPLLLWRMLREHELIDGNAAASIDAGVLAWLEGEHELDRALAGRAQILPLGAELPDWPLDATAAVLREGLRRDRRMRVHVTTGDVVAARWFAAALGQRLGMPALDVPRATLAGEAEAAVRLHRQAFLDGCIPCVALDDADLSRPAGVLPFPLQIVCGEGALPEPAAGTQDIVCGLSPPDPTERERLWRRLWPECAAWPAGDLADLALCHAASVTDIAAAAASAPIDAAAAAQLLRARARGDLGPLARRIDAVFGWDDLVVPAPVRERLQEVAFEARERIRVWSTPQAARLFPYGRGLVALLAGPPGTGKTMAAQVIAADLELDLLAVDLSAVVSKWVGETAQHIQALLSSQAAQHSVLFFDEADALYAKRVEDVRDAQDRFANLDTSHLMTALEAYPGVVLLASNLKANIDSAFLRRIRHVVDFTRPDADAREQIWLKAVEALFPPETARGLRPEIRRVARIEATGALIKNAALSALFASRRTGAAPTARLFGDMLARELAKEGAGISTRELASLLEAAP